MALEDSRSFLRQTNEDGVSVYSHLTEVLATLLINEKPDQALESLEGTSLACKKTHYSAASAIIPAEPPEAPVPPSADEAASAAWHSSHAGLLAPKSGEEEPGDQGEVKDTLAERSLFECAGVGLSKEETYMVYASLLQLQQTAKLATVRFFGKVLGTGADYYVAEATYAEPPEPPEEPPPPPPGAPVEETGTGCNAFVYFATTDLSGAWTALPEVTPQQIVASTLIRKYLTGTLDADVRAYPPFPGKEASYLRALLARISHSTTLAPVGKFVMEEDAEPGAPPVDAAEGEEYKPTATAECGAVGGWCSRYMGILDIGRTTNPPSEEEETEEGEKPKGPEPQPEIKALAPISADEWSTACYYHGGPPVAIARSTLWPGAYCAYKLAGSEQTFTSLYIGYGHNALPAVFRVQPPPPFMTEPDELAEQEDAPLDDENVDVIAKF